MKRIVLHKWLDSLRNGTYNSTKGRLRKEDKFDPLGVLCDISELGSWSYDESYERFEYLGQTNYLPKEVIQWSGMKDEDAKMLQAFIITMTDEYKNSFEEVAKMLEDKFSIKGGENAV